MGFFIGFTNLFAPIHEWSHVVSAGLRGVEGHIVDWTHASIGGSDFRAIVTAGWFGELVIFAGFAIVGMYAGGRFPGLTGGFGIGYCASTLLRGFSAHDFSTGIVTYLSMFPTLTDVQRADLFRAYYDRVMGLWTALGLIVVAGGLTLAVILVKRRGRPVRRPFPMP